MQIEATLPNAEAPAAAGHVRQRHGRVGEKKRYLTLPQTAITYNPYGDDRVRRQAGRQARTPRATPQLVAQQVFVTTGPTRGDQVAILKGLEPGTQVVTSGQLKLKNGTPLVIDNSVQPANSPNPTPQEQ